MTEYLSHTPVLLQECLDLLKPDNLAEPARYLDLTFGRGGHSFAFLEKYKNLSVVGIDQDTQAIQNGLQMIDEKNISSRIQLVHSNFKDFLDTCDSSFDAILADIGVSSHQFDQPERGFSFRHEAKLDMRMDQTNNELTAEMIVNNYPEEELANLIFQYGEERLSRRIAASIVEKRKVQKLTTTKELEDICFHAYPKATRFGKIHPATRTFQALRIAVNNELEVLKDSIDMMFKCLKPGGKVGIISFHSLEDRIVKHQFKMIYQNNQEICQILTKRPVTASSNELESNPRSRSAKLRVMKKLML